MAPTAAAVETEVDDGGDDDASSFFVSPSPSSSPSSPSSPSPSSTEKTESISQQRISHDANGYLNLILRSASVSFLLVSRSRFSRER